MLENEPPIVVHSKLVSEYMDVTDDSCPMVPYIRNMYQMKYRNRILESTTGPDPIRAIAQMRGMPEFYNCIDEVDYYPFSCFYSTSSQQRFSREESYRKDSYIAIDSTGVSVILPPECEISTRTNTMKRCMLYNIVILGSKTSKAVYQMLTQSHNSTQIFKMLDLFKEKQHHDKNPKEVFIDESPALLLACVKVFLSMNSTNEYIDYCFDCLMTKDKVKKTYIRIDRSHVVKTIHRIKKIKKLRNPRTVFYQRALGYLIQIKDFEEAKRMMNELFRCVNEQFLSQNDKNRENLIESVKNHNKFDSVNEDKEANVDSDYADPFESEYIESRANIKRNKFFDFVQNLAEKHRTTHNDENDVFDNLKNRSANPLYAPNLESTLIEVLAKLPLYGNILNDCFK